MAGNPAIAELTAETFAFVTPVTPMLLKATGAGNAAPEEEVREVNPDMSGSALVTVMMYEPTAVEFESLTRSTDCTVTVTVFKPMLTGMFAEAEPEVTAVPFTKIAWPAKLLVGVRTTNCAEVGTAIV